MDFAFTDEHDELRQTVRKFLENKSDEQAVRSLMQTEQGYDGDVWAQMAEQMGLQGLIVPELYGGAGLGAVELTVVLEEMGAALLCAPFFSSAVLATNTLLHAADENTKGDILPAIACGKSLATLAYAEPNGRWDLAGIEMEAARDGKAWRLDGIKTYVIDGHVANEILVLARAEGTLALFRVDALAPGLARELLPTLDLTRKLARLTFSGVPATKVSDATDVEPAMERVLALAATGLAAEQAGGAQRCLHMSTEYAKTRLQFGRPIGSFQAIKHRCADMLVQVEFAKSAAYHAGFTAAEGDPAELLTAASLAKSYCSEAYFHAAAETIQIHGGMGFTWEHPAHLYFKRAKSSALLFGDAVHHRERLARQVGI
jgi:alkylation response protein AidB-like acyl-CoA dehydrogenase